MKFTEETMQSLREYGAVLREIHDRLVKEGKLKDCKFGKFKGKIKKGEVLFKKI